MHTHVLVRKRVFQAIVWCATLSQTNCTCIYVFMYLQVWILYSNNCIFINVRKYTNRYIYVYMYTCPFMYMVCRWYFACPNLWMYLCTYLYAYTTYKRTHIHRNVCKQLYIRIYIHIHTCKHIYIYAVDGSTYLSIYLHLYKYTHVNIHVNVHWNICVYIYIYMYTYVCECVCVCV